MALDAVKQLQAVGEGEGGGGGLEPGASLIKSGSIDLSKFKCWEVEETWANHRIIWPIPFFLITS